MYIEENRLYFIYEIFNFISKIFYPRRSKVHRFFTPHSTRILRKVLRMYKHITNRYNLIYLIASTILFLKPHEVK